ncbi:hypothetical protein Q0Z83_045760 [Actinoplanes sichuanensis]|uniref:DUF4230 domain-containing protein n=1 Tax=Actinoplanes sichuanensis TaxID=512349 RepID=A0ABW4AAG0_9ACTN|nr:hypothetical protein [Actinoplanes sichuanensis]BEL06385.1 hypothetical protein Q0Z83_045760 [Actinoplanes sichuanensis]
MQRTPWRKAVDRRLPMALPVITVGTLALVVANVRLLVPVGVGVLLAFLFWRISYAFKFVAFTLVIALLWLAGCAPAEFGWSIHYRVAATLIPDGTRWDIVDEITVPADRVVEAVAADGAWFDDQIDPSAPEEFRRTLAEDLRTLEGILAKQGWVFTRILDGDEAVFTRRRSVESAQGGMFPLVSRQSLAIPDIELFAATPLSASTGPGSPAPWARRVVFTPADDSEILIEAGRNVIAATNPPSEAEPVPAGEQRRIVSGDSSVELSLLSPVSRHEPVRSITQVSLAEWTGWVLAFVWALVLALAQDGVKQGLARLFGRKTLPNGRPASPDRPSRADDESTS